MRQLVLVGVLLGAASSPARDARTTFTVGAYVVESCEVSTVASRSDARCAAMASRELRAIPQASVASDSPAGTQGARPAAAGASAREAASTSPREAAAASAPRVLLIRF